MNTFDKITKIKFSVFGIYYLSFFLPIYSQNIWGSVFKVSISELGAGTFFVIFFAVAIVLTVIMKFLAEKYYKYAYLSTVGFMVLLFFILLLFKESTSTLRVTWYIHFILIGVLLFAHFKEVFTIRVFDKIVAKTQAYMNKLIRIFREKNDKRKMKKSSKDSSKLEESINEEESE